MQLITGINAVVLSSLSATINGKLKPFGTMAKAIQGTSVFIHTQNGLISNRKDY
ncbi:MAG TPA: hypothetical protein VLG12_03070 [Candidatus Saccharimonadales bacterium]|nr:hypothetical protein [Candidatus Saccharimonadales bacterium]